MDDNEKRCDDIDSEGHSKPGKASSERLIGADIVTIMVRRLVREVMRIEMSRIGMARVGGREG